MDTRTGGNISMQLPPSSQGGQVVPSTLISMPSPQALLVHQMFNETLNGIHGVQYETQIGMTERALRTIFGEFSLWVNAQQYDSDGVIVLWDEKGLPASSFERMYTAEEIRVLRNMTEFVMLDLGHEEFQTRTGFGLVDAKRLLDELNAALLDPLHLDRQLPPVAH
jgi:hypothetical protein